MKDFELEECLRLIAEYYHRADKAETDLVKTTAELVACEKERDAMRRVVDVAAEVVDQLDITTQDECELVVLRELVSAYRKIPK